MRTMTITIERTAKTLKLGNTTVQAEELGIKLGFARKPDNLSEIGDDFGYLEYTKVYVTETKELTAEQFDAFASKLFMPCDWLRGKGGGIGDGCLCVEVIAPDRPRLYVNPEGSDHARYVARLG